MKKAGDKMTNREIMLKALKSTVIKELKEQGFTGKYPHFKKKKEDCIELISFQTNKYGGSFTVELSAVFPNSKITNLSDPNAQVDENDVEVACTNQRYRLEGMFDGWFYYRDVYRLPTGYYEDIPESKAEAFLPPKKWELVQGFDEKTAEEICEEISLQLDDAFEWLFDFERKSLKKNVRHIKPAVEEEKVFNKRILVLVADFFIMLMGSLLFLSGGEKGLGVFFLILTVLFISVIFMTPKSYVFSEERLVINYFFGLKENIFWQNVRYVLKTHENVTRRTYLDVYEVGYYSEEKRAFFMRGRVSKNNRTQELMEKYCPKRIR